MKKMSRLPHEQSIPDSDTGFGPTHDGLPTAETDVEGHGATPGEGFLPGMPGTGGDNFRRPTSGGEIATRVTGDEDDVEGHAMGHTKGERFLPGMPGTGGDQIDVPATGDEDAEGLS